MKQILTYEEITCRWAMTFIGDYENSQKIFKNTLYSIIAAKTNASPVNIQKILTGDKNTSGKYECYCTILSEEEKQQAQEKAATAEFSRITFDIMPYRHYAKIIYPPKFPQDSIYAPYVNTRYIHKSEYKMHVIVTDVPQNAAPNDYQVIFFDDQSQCLSVGNYKFSTEECSEKFKEFQIRKMRQLVEPELFRTQLLSDNELEAILQEGKHQSNGYYPYTSAYIRQKPWPIYTATFAYDDFYQHMCFVPVQPFTNLYIHPKGYIYALCDENNRPILSTPRLNHLFAS